MPLLDPHAQTLLDVINASGVPSLHTLTVDDARRRMRAALVTKQQVATLVNVKDCTLPTPAGPLRLRMYVPGTGQLPIALFLHGGGWVLNDLDTHDHLCRRIAKRSGTLIVALDYRRAPEHKHPAALEDAHTAYTWLVDHAKTIGGDAKAVAVVGESSGATMAASLTLRLREAGARMPTYQILAYPLTDVVGRWPSHRERGQGYILNRDELDWFVEQYVPHGHDSTDQDLYPLAARDLAGLPPALVMTAEFDPLRDEGIAYADRLANAGVAVTHTHAHDQMHGFLLHSRVIPRAGELVNDIADALISHARRSRT